MRFDELPPHQDRALAFYSKKLGFTIQTDQSFGEQRWIELGIPGAQFGIVLFTPDEHKTYIGTFSHVSFFTDDIDDTYNELVKRGVEFDGPPEKMPWGTFVKFKDPDCNGFVLSAR